MTTHDEARLSLLGRLIADAPLNLVSRGDRGDVRGIHIDEALAVARRLPMKAGSRWVDLGTGGGLPGLVLALVFPDVRWTLLDATAKKIAAVEGFARALELDNVEAVHGRAEDLARRKTMRGSFDGVVTRALAALPVAAELARSFLVDGGVFAAVKGPRHEEEMTSAHSVLHALRFRPPVAERVPDTVRPTWLVTMRAVGDPPDGVPRPNGVPQSQPIGGRTS